VENSILVAVKDSVSSRIAVDYLCDLPLHKEDVHIVLLDVFRRPSLARDELMGEKFVEEETSRLLSILQEARDKLVEKGFSPDKVKIDFMLKPYPTVCEAIIDKLRQRDCNMLIIGRRRKSKAEEFMFGDVSVKLVRKLEGMAVCVVTR